MLVISWAALRSMYSMVWATLLLAVLVFTIFNRTKVAMVVETCPTGLQLPVFMAIGLLGVAIFVMTLYPFNIFDALIVGLATGLTIYGTKTQN